MTLEFTSWGMTLLRAACIGLAALWLSGPLVATLARTGDRRMRRVAWGLLFAPLLTPAILVGYAYKPHALALVRHEVWQELLYSSLLALKLVPVAAMAVYFAPPPPISPQAMHCARLLGARQPGTGHRFINKVGFWLRGPARTRLAALGLVLLLAFGDFELATLLEARSWTIAVFESQAGGTPLIESIRLAIVPLTCQLVVLGTVLLVLVGSRRRLSAGPRAAIRPPGWRRPLVWGYLAGAFALVVGYPVVSIAVEATPGMRSMLASFAMAKEFGASVVFAIGGAVLAMLIASWLAPPLRSRQIGRWRLAAALGFCLPGLLGPLLLGLALLAVVQWVRAARYLPVERYLPYELPLLVGLTLWLLPIAVLLMLLRQALRPGTAIHAARMLQDSSSKAQRACGANLIWDLEHRPRFWSAALLLCFAFFDLTLSSLLAPIGTATTAVERLYNFMHYGHDQVLSAMVCLLILIPTILIVLGVAASRLVLKWRAHA